MRPASVVLTLGAVVTIPSALGHGNILEPEAVWVDTYADTGFSAELDGPAVFGKVDNQKYGWGEPGNIAAFADAFPKSKYKSIKELIMDKQKLLPDKKGTTECGCTVKDESKRVNLPPKIKFSGLGHGGPCEIWCDNTKVFYELNCSGKFGERNSVIPFDNSKCKGADRFTFYWLGMTGDPWQVYITCLWLKDGSGSSRSLTARTPGGNSTNTPRPLPAPPAPIDPNPAPPAPIDPNPAPQPSLAVELLPPSPTSSLAAKKKRTNCPDLVPAVIGYKLPPGCEREPVLPERFKVKTSPSPIREELTPRPLPSPPAPIDPNPAPQPSLAVELLPPSPTSSLGAKKKRTNCPDLAPTVIGYKLPPGCEREPVPNERVKKNLSPSPARDELIPIDIGYNAKQSSRNSSTSQTSARSTDEKKPVKESFNFGDLA